MQPENDKIPTDTLSNWGDIDMEEAYPRDRTLELTVEHLDKMDLKLPLTKEDIKTACDYFCDLEVFLANDLEEKKPVDRAFLDDVCDAVDDYIGLDDFEYSLKKLNEMLSETENKM